MTYAIFTNSDLKNNKIKEEIKKNINIEYDDINPNYVIVIGGDGTILSAVHHYEKKLNDLVFIGINNGHLGFYTNFGLEDLNLIIKALNNNIIKYEEHYLIEYSLLINNKKRRGIALNEVTLINSPKILDLEISIDNKVFEIFRGTGVCISSPTGSTAYNKSLGGAIIDHHLKTFQLAEIASINSNVYQTLNSPLILAQNRKITLSPISNKNMIFTADNESINISSWEKLDLKLARTKIKFGYIKEIDFIDRIRKGFL